MSLEKLVNVLRVQVWPYQSSKRRWRGQWYQIKRISKKKKSIQTEGKV